MPPATMPWMAGFDLEGVFAGDDYLYFSYPDKEAGDARSDVEAGQVAGLLELRAGMRVLDAPCGHGRIAQRLAERGCQVVGIDQAAHFVDLAKRNAAARGLDVEYRVGDLRALDAGPEFDAVISWFTSFGYFDDPTDRDILRRYHAALKPGGRLLLDHLNRDRLLRFFNPGSDHAQEVGEDLMLDRSTFDPVSGRVATTRFISRGGRMRRTRFSLRVFAFTEIRDWLGDAGFHDVQACDRDGARFEVDSARMVVLASA